MPGTLAAGRLWIGSSYRWVFLDLRRSSKEVLVLELQNYRYEVISSNVKVAAAGASLDVPLGHKDDSWSFPHFDTITVSVADAPRPDEILVVMAIADGGRLRNRCGTEPIR
jgi:hypothetical protein